MVPALTARQRALMAKMNPIELQKYLRGAAYPATKEQLVRRAEQNGADENIRRVLDQLPMDRFNSPNDVSEALGKAQ
jgi:hypothetical protein